MNINPLHDAETQRQHRNLTNSQRKNNLTTKEGVLVNNFVKDKDCNLTDTKDTYLISDKIAMPSQLYEDKKIIDKKLIPLSGIAIGVMASVAGLTGFVNRSAKVATDLAKEKWLPAVTRNVGEMTYNQCAAIGAMLKAQKNAQARAEAAQQQHLQALANFQKTIANAHARIMELATMISNKMPAIIANPVNFILTQVVAKVLNLVQNL